MRVVAALTLALLAAAPFVLASVHDDHDGERCPICKIGQIPVVGIDVADGSAPPLVSQPLRTPVVLAATGPVAYRPFAPRGPPLV
jgi:hypothetical protein